MSIEIIKGSTRVAIKVDRNNPAALYLKNLASRVLTDHEFNPRLKRLVPTKRYAVYDDKAEMLYLPVNLADDVIGLFTDMGFEYKLIDEPFHTCRDLKIKMKESFVPREHQVPVIEHLKQDLPRRKGLAIQTGSGKTVSSIAGAIAYGKSFMIVVSRLHHQWAESLYQFTNIRRDQLCIIQGINSLIDVLSSERKPEVFIFSLETLRAYCLRKGDYAELPPFSEFVKYFGIGTKIMDEVHLNFHADTIIDLSCNVPNNIYLTATFTSGNPGTRKIFNIIYPSKMRFGEDREFDKYTDVYCYGYYGDVPEYKGKYYVVGTQRGYSHIKYEKYLLKRPMFLKNYVEHVISPLIFAHYINRRLPGQKIAIFFAMIEMVEYVYNWCKTTFPDLVVNKFIAGSPDKVLVDSDIIITTAKSMGVGTDCKGLITVINTVSTKSPPAVLQICGRLRKIPNITTQYIDLVDMNLRAHKHYQREREAILRPTVKNYFKYKLP